MVQFNYSKYYNNINSSKLFYGLAIIILNLFSKHIQLNLSKSQEAYVKTAITREIFIFTVIFVGTHDIITSILLTAALLILSSTIFNERSRFCIMSEKYKKLDKVLDTNNDNYVSDIEIERAHDILYKANLQNNNL